MRIELAHARLAFACVALLCLAACGQTGALVLPGAVPAEATQNGAVSESEDQEDDESDR